LSSVSIAVILLVITGVASYYLLEALARSVKQMNPRRSKLKSNTRVGLYCSSVINKDAIEKWTNNRYKVCRDEAMPASTLVLVCLPAASLSLLPAACFACRSRPRHNRSIGGSSPFVLDRFSEQVPNWN